MFQLDRMGFESFIEEYKKIALTVLLGSEADL